MIHAKFVGRNRPENETLLYLLLRVEMVVFIAGRFFYLFLLTVGCKRWPAIDWAETSSHHHLLGGRYADLIT